MEGWGPKPVFAIGHLVEKVLRRIHCRCVRIEDLDLDLDLDLCGRDWGWES
jgi:hypothetical protein